MFKRLKAIEAKLDAISREQRLHKNMLIGIMQTLDQRRDMGAEQRRALSNYVDSVAGILDAKGAPPEFVQSFRDLLGQAGNIGKTDD